MTLLGHTIDIDELLTRFVAFLPHVIAALAILAIFWIIYRVARAALRPPLHHAGLHPKLIDLLIDSLFRYVLMIFGLVMALDQLGVNVGTALAGIGVAGIALGFAAQDSLANIIAGFIIFWDKPFVVGDWLLIDKHLARVEDITLRSTRIRTNRNTYVIVANKRIIDMVLENLSTQGEIRLDLPVGIPYDQDVARVRELLIPALAKVENVRTDLAPTVVLSSFGDSSVNLLVRVWTDKGEWVQPVTYGALEAVKRTLDDAGIPFSSPQMMVTWQGVEDRVVDKLQPLAGS